MPSIYLPSLKKVIIKNFSLYPKKEVINYEFIPGVNLVIGGNGMGKTTFLNLIKFAMIGLYRKGVVVKRREIKGVEIREEKRDNISYQYFENRMDLSSTSNDESYIELTFATNKTLHIIRRRLIDGAVLKYYTKSTEQLTEDEVEYLGKVVSQEKFDELYRNPEDNKETIGQTLQFIYEQNVVKYAGLANFDILIFLLNDVLFFNEERRTIMWESDFQDTFTALFLINPKYINMLAKHRLDAKYHDSLARHKGEDIRALKKVYDRLKKQPNFDKTLVELMDLKKGLAFKSEKLFDELRRIQDKRNLYSRESNRLSSKRNETFKSIQELESSYFNLEHSFYTDLFSDVTPKYWQYLKFLKSNKDCPLCNNELPKNKFECIISDESSCMMCGTNLPSNVEESTALIEAQNNVSKLRATLINIENKSVQIELDLDNLDKEYKKKQGSYNQIKSELRNVDFSIDKTLNKNDTNNDHEFSELKKRMDELDAQKELNSIKSKNAKEKAKELMSEIDEDRISGTLKLSSIFNKYASKFLGVKCELVYDDPGDKGGKRYLPRIDGTDRNSPEELSESQRFFIDQAFRMSLLSFFADSSSFLLSETPDASLDISYERNAAEVYLEFIKDPNELVLTSNLNNSDFLRHLITGTSKEKIGHINLLNYGKTSGVQSNSIRLKEASIAIEKLF